MAKQLTLRGAGPGTLIDGGDGSEDVTANALDISDGADGSTFQNLRLQTTLNASDAVNATQCDDLDFTDIVIEDAADAGILMFNCDRGFLANVRVKSSGEDSFFSTDIGRVHVIGLTVEPGAGQIRYSGDAQNSSLIGSHITGTNIEMDADNAAVVGNTIIEGRLRLDLADETAAIANTVLNSPTDGIVVNGDDDVLVGNTVFGSSGSDFETSSASGLEARGNQSSDDTAEDIDTGYKEKYSYSTGHSEWADSLTNEEVDRIDLQAGEKLVVDRIEFRQKGGGSSSSASVRVRDTGAASTIGSQDLGGTTKDPGESGDGNTVVVQVTNSTGGSIDASIKVTGRILGA